MAGNKVWWPGKVSRAGKDFYGRFRLSINDDQREYRSAIRKLGKHGVLLSRSEFACFHIARRYQRHTLRRQVLALDHLLWPRALDRLRWSSSPLRRCGQGLVLAVSLPFIVIGQLLGRLLGLLLFPFRYARTFAIPRGLAAPGEKTLVGIHNAFARFFDLPPEAYINCVDEWIRALYGCERSLREYLSATVVAEGVAESAAEGTAETDLSPSMRSYIAVARERLSKELGNYRP